MAAILPTIISAARKYPRGSISILLTTILLLLVLLHETEPSSSSFQWPSLLPTPDIHPYRYSHAVETSTEPVDLDAELADLYSHFVRVYASHSKSSPPLPVYSKPGLTPSQERRYAHLRYPKPPLRSIIKHKDKADTIQGKYMITTLTREISSQLPDLLNTILVLVHFLGVEHLSFSFLEGPSDDATPVILNAVLHPLLLALGVPESQIRIETHEPRIDFDTVNRIEKLAELRNRALEPLWIDNKGGSGSEVGTNVVAVIFFNDVFLRAADVLETLHQHVEAGKKGKPTGITTGWDWMEREPEYFYDVWVSRTVDPAFTRLFPRTDPFVSPRSTRATSSTPSRGPGGPLPPRFSPPRPPRLQSSARSNLSKCTLHGTPSPSSPRHPSFHPSTNVSDAVTSQTRNAPRANVPSSPKIFGGWDGVESRWFHLFRQLAYSRDIAEQTARMLAVQQAELGWVDGVPPIELDEVVDWVTVPPAKVRCHPWPESNGLTANVWATTQWVDPY
ncbi:alpha-1,3-mannosyltransferase, partial [Tremellales sp. Uapishka_1]